MMLSNGEPSGVSAAEQGPNARIVDGPVQLSASLALSTLASVFAFTPWRMVEAELYTHAQPPVAKCWTQRVGEGEVSTVCTRNGEGVVCANYVVRALLSVGGQVAIGQVVTGQTQVSHDTSAVDNRQGGAWESAHVDLVGRQTHRHADGVVASEFDVGKMQVPIVLSLVDDHSQHLGQSVVHPLNAPLQLG